MRLDVRFVDHVHAQLVTQVEQPWVVRVVRAPQRSDVRSAHRQQVGAHVLDGHRLAANGVMVMAIDPEDPDPLTVHQERPVAHFDPTESDELLDCVDDAIAVVAQLGNQSISRR